MSNQMKSYKVPEGFSLAGAVDMLCAKYTALGYQTSVRPIGSVVEVTVSKNIGGLWILTGLGESLSVTLSYDNASGTLSVMLSGHYFVDKVVAFVVGWCCLWFLWIPAAIGLYRQIKLPDDIDASLYQYIAGMR